MWPGWFKKKIDYTNSPCFSYMPCESVLQAIQLFVRWLRQSFLLFVDFSKAVIISVLNWIFSYTGLKRKCLSMNYISYKIFFILNLLAYILYSEFLFLTCRYKLWQQNSASIPWNDNSWSQLAAFWWSHSPSSVPHSWPSPCLPASWPPCSASQGHPPTCAKKKIILCI